MNRQRIQEVIVSLVNECEINRSERYDKSLFSADFRFQVCDMVYVMINVNKIFHIPMEELTEHLELYSVAEIVNCVDLYLKKTQQNHNVTSQ